VRIVATIVLLATFVATPGISLACGQYKKSNPPSCYPTTPTPQPTAPPIATPVPPTSTPVATVAPTPAATSVPASPVAIAVLQVAPSVPSSPVIAAPVQQSDSAGSSRRRDEWCHYEPTTGLWELRVWGKGSPNDRQPMTNGLCEQEAPQPTPTAAPAVPNPVLAIESDVPMPVEVVVPESVPEQQPEQPQTPEAQPEVEQPSDQPQPCEVPVQIPEWSCLTPESEVSE